MVQNYEHTESTVSLEDLANKALATDERLCQFQEQNKGASTSSNQGSKKETQLSTASSGASRGKMSVGEKVYQIGTDGKAKKGTIQKIGKNAKGLSIPTIKWDDGTTEDTTFKSIKKDEYPSTPVATSKPKASGPAPMDLDSAQGKGKKPVVCSNCGSRGHYSNQCPTKPYSGQEAQISEGDSENEDL